MRPRRRLPLAAALVLAGAAVAGSSACAQDRDAALTAYDFVLDYDVPASPAFTVLGTAPSSVTTGAAAKPLVVTLLDQFLTGGELSPGLAVDVVPYTLLGGGFLSRSDYARSTVRQILANTQLSLGTAEVPGDPASLQLGWGARASLADTRDPLRSETWGRQLEDRLTRLLVPDDDGPVDPGALGGSGDTEPDVEQSVESVEGLSAVYDDVIRQMRGEFGGALAVGGGQALLFRGASTSPDSVEVTRTMLWVAGQVYTGLGFDVLASVQGRFDRDADDDVRLGVGLRGGTVSTEVVGEVAYTTARGRLDYGVGVTLPLVEQVKLGAGLGTASAAADPDDEGRLRVTVRLFYNLAAH